MVRVWMPDRPGALGQVASRIGSVGADVVGVEILERGAGRVTELLDLLVQHARYDWAAVVDLDSQEVRAEVGPSPGAPWLAAFVEGSSGTPAACASGRAPAPPNCGNAPRPATTRGGPHRPPLGRPAA